MSTITDAWEDKPTAENSENRVTLTLNQQDITFTLGAIIPSTTTPGQYYILSKKMDDDTERPTASTLVSAKELSILLAESEEHNGIVNATRSRIQKLRCTHKQYPKVS